MNSTNTQSWIQQIHKFFNFIQIHKVENWKKKKKNLTWCTIIDGLESRIQKVGQIICINTSYSIIAISINVNLFAIQKLFLKQSKKIESIWKLWDEFSEDFVSLTSNEVLAIVANDEIR